MPLYTPGIYDQVIDLPVVQLPQILISEKEYLQLKNEVGYWHAMHKKAVLREKELKQIVKKQEGKIRDLRSRLFGKKARKEMSKRMKAKQNLRRPNVLVVSNLGARGMAVHSVRIFHKERKRLIFLKLQHALNVGNTT